MTMNPRHYPRVDESFARLHCAGWSIGETGGAGVWVVSGTNGENVIHAEGRSQAEAWYLSEPVALKADRLLVPTMSYKEIENE
jgi:hypothetical protein